MQCTFKIEINALSPCEPIISLVEFELDAVIAIAGMPRQVQSNLIFTGCKKCGSIENLVYESLSRI